MARLILHLARDRGFGISPWPRRVGHCARARAAGMAAGAGVLVRHVRLSGEVCGVSNDDLSASWLWHQRSVGEQW